MEMLNEGNVNVFGVTAVITGVTAFIVWLLWNPTITYFGVLKMKKERRENLHNYYVGKLVGLVEDDIKEGHLTRQEAVDEIYNPFKRVFYTQKDLFPIPETMKKGIQSRLNNGVHEPIPSPLPDVKKVKNLLGR